MHKLIPFITRRDEYCSQKKSILKIILSFPLIWLLFDFKFSVYRKKRQQVIGERPPDGQPGAIGSSPGFHSSEHVTADTSFHLSGPVLPHPLSGLERLRGPSQPNTQSEIIRCQPPYL